MQFGFVIDNRKCIGCHACTVACKAEHDVPIGVNRTWVKYIEKGTFPDTTRHFSVMRCNHCADAPCVEICPVTALFRRKDGIVDFDNQRCIGCKACMQACPYDALYIDPETHTAAKCNYCAHRVDIGLEPACVNVCPEHAIVSGDLDDPGSGIAGLVAKEQVTVRKGEKGTDPQLFYIDGDLASLDPGRTEAQDDYLWSSQEGGVGHFARFAEKRRQQGGDASGPSPAAQAPGASSASAGGLKAARTAGAKASNPASYGSAADASKYRPGAGVSSPGGGGASPSPASQKSPQPRRVYDAPDKGVLWGWEVSGYIWTKALASGCFLVPYLLSMAEPASSGLWTGFLAAALLFLGLTGLLLVKDLDQPARFAYVLLRPQWKSWLVRGAYIITAYGGLLTIAFLWTLSRWLNPDSTALSASDSWMGVSGWPLVLMAVLGSVTALASVGAAVYTAFLFAQAKGRDLWQSPLAALQMLIHAPLAGSAGLALLSPWLDLPANWIGPLVWLLGGSLTVHLALLGLEMWTPHATRDAHRAASFILRGRLAGAFWGGAVILGGLLPLALLLLATGWPLGAPADGTPLAPLLALAGLAALIGLYFSEHVWVRAPQWIRLS